MNESLKQMVEELQGFIKAAYEESVTVTEAERLAARFLSAQLDIANALQTAELDARMRKSGVKAIKAAVYLESASKGEKKPSDVLLGAVVDSSDLVQGEQGRMDEAEVYADYLRSVYGVFKEAHIYMRGIAKGNFNG